MSFFSVARSWHRFGQKCIAMLADLNIYSFQPREMFYETNLKDRAQQETKFRHLLIKNEMWKKKIAEYTGLETTKTIVWYSLLKNLKLGTIFYWTRRNFFFLKKVHLKWCAIKVFLIQSSNYLKIMFDFIIMCLQRKSKVKSGFPSSFSRLLPLIYPQLTLSMIPCCFLK